MGDETRVDVYKRLTLDLLGGVGGWMGFDDIAADFEMNDGEVDRNALGAALGELVDLGQIAHEVCGGDDEYRIAPQQEGESLAEKVKRLEAENERLRAEQAADRAAVTALVEALPKCWECSSAAATKRYQWADDETCDAHDAGFPPERGRDINYAAPLRALQARMATWLSDAGASAHHAATEAVSDDVQAGSRGLTFEEAARRYPEALERAVDTVAARFDAADPKWHRLLDTLKRRYPKDAAPEARDAPPRFVGEFGDIDERSPKAPQSSLILSEREVRLEQRVFYDDGRPCRIIPDVWYPGKELPIARPLGLPSEPDDEPSVGDVDGYGRRG